MFSFFAAKATKNKENWLRLLLLAIACAANTIIDQYIFYDSTAGVGLLPRPLLRRMANSILRTDYLKIIGM